MHQHNKLLISADDAADVLGLKIPQVYALARDGIVPSVRVGRRVMFSLRALEDWIDRGGTPLAGGWRRHSTGQAT